MLPCAVPVPAQAARAMLPPVNIAPVSSTSPMRPATAPLCWCPIVAVTMCTLPANVACHRSSCNVLSCGSSTKGTPLSLLPRAKAHAAAPGTSKHPECCTISSTPFQQRVRRYLWWACLYVACLLAHDGSMFTAEKLFRASSGGEFCDWCARLDCVGRYTYGTYAYTGMPLQLAAGLLPGILVFLIEAASSTPS